VAYGFVVSTRKVAAVLRSPQERVCAAFRRGLPVLPKGNRSLKVRDRYMVPWRMRLDEWLQSSATAERMSFALVGTRDQTPQDPEIRLLRYKDRSSPGVALKFSQRLQVRVQTWPVRT